MWWALSAAFAADPVAETRAMLEQNPALGMALVCSPLEGLIGVLSQLPPLANAAPTEKNRYWLELVRPGGAAAAGLDGAGSVVMSTAGGQLALQVPFSGDRAQAEALLEELAPQGEVTAEGDGWTVLDGSREILATLAEGILTLRAEEPGDAWPGAADVSPLALLAGLPEGDGCLTYIATPPVPPGAPFPLPKAIVVSLPLSDDPATIRFAPHNPPPATLQGAGAAPPEIRTTSVPLAVVTLGVDPLALIAELPPMPLGIQPSPDLGRVRERLSVPPGAMLAFYALKPQPRMAMALPMADPEGDPLSWRKLRRWMERGESPPTWTSRRTFTLQNGPWTFHGAVENGRMLLASDAGLVAELVAQEGQPWLSPEQAAWSARWPVAVTLDPSQLIPGLPAMTLNYGVRATPGYWEVALKVPGEATSASALAGMIGAIAVPNFVQMQARAKRAEAPANVDGIYTAELAYNYAFDELIPAEPTPRPVDALTEEAVPWPAPSELSGFDQIGWMPDGDVRGTYWVEVSPDGSSFTVHGMIDSDGDGVPAHYRRTLGGDLEQVTGPDVF